MGWIVLCLGAARAAAQTRGDASFLVPPERGQERQGSGPCSLRRRCQATWGRDSRDVIYSTNSY